MARSKGRTTTQAYMNEDDVSLDRIFLALDNPRHEPVETESQAIERLCNKEDVLPLARDIVKHGLSPLERFAVTPIGKTKAGAQTYSMAEGNRRICALKLLADPDLAPPKFRQAFEALADTWVPIRKVHTVVFHDKEVLRLWLDRVHNGPQGGIGRKSWDAEQKQRFSGSAKNRLAQAVLDYAESQGMLTKTERQGKLTTTQRFLSPEAVRETLGIDLTSPGELTRNRPKAEFDLILRKFIEDLKAGEEVNSRKNKADIVKYARGLAATPGVTPTRIDSEPLATVPEVVRGNRTRVSPKKPQKARHVGYSPDVNSLLKNLGNEKLERLYYSICQIELEFHAPLIAIGVWAFFETLTAAAGRTDSTSFEAFLSKAKLTALGITGEDQKAVRSAVERIAEYGNLTKHHKVSAAFNGDQINNDMTTLQATIVGLIGLVK